MKKWLISSLLGVTLLGGSLAAMVHFAPEVTVHGAMSFERWRNGLTAKTVEVDGFTWHYLEGGKTGAPTILMVHGFSANKDNWVRFAGRLTSDYHIVIPDLPGYGDSVRDLKGDYRLPEQRERLQVFVKALKIDKLHIIGSSMGGNVSALYTFAEPQRVQSMALVGASGVTEPNPSAHSIQVKTTGNSSLLVATREGYDKTLAFVMEHPPVIPTFVKDVLAQKAIADRPLYASILHELVADKRSALEPILPQIKVPTLLVWGEQDRARDISGGQLMHQLMPHSQWVAMKNTGHLPHLERVDETAEIYVKFLAGVK